MLPLSPTSLLRTLPLAALALSFSAATVHAQDERNIEEISITATPLSAGAPDERLPISVQSFSREELERLEPLSIADFLDQAATSFTRNDIQNNPLQPDLQYRGFTASPLLGTPQGISIFQNGVRLNDNFGHAVNWDLLPDFFVDRVTVVGGANPLFGLNTLGGAILVETKTGFENPGGEAVARYGSFDRAQLSAGMGGHDGRFGLYVGADHFQEDGWRDFSDSEATNLYAAASWRSEDTTLDLYLNGGDTDLRGNGAIPLYLLETDRDSVFTHPDRTENRMGQASLAASHTLTEDASLNARLFFRKTRTKSFNGDGAEAEECDDPFDAFLCAEEDDEGAGDGPAFLHDQDGNRVSADYDGVNNRSRRKEQIWGGALEAEYRLQTGGITHNFLFGTDYVHGRTNFSSSVEFASLTEERGTEGSGLFDAEGYTDMRSVTDSVGIYAGDTVLLTDALSATLSGRYAHVTVDSEDLSGERPDLTAKHSYDRVNFGAGLSYTVTPLLTFYGGVHQSSRTPTPVELACSHVDAPCTLPNSFVADPPLEDVVSRGVEAGIRGAGGFLDSWRAGVFRIVNRDDIIFQTTGGVTANEGFFSNVGNTRRQGVELTAAGRFARLRWSVNYSYLDATFRDAFLVSSPQHPAAADGSIPVEPGDRIPGLPRHQLGATLFADITEKLQLGLLMTARSGQYFRGDEGNLLSKTDAYAVFGGRARYRLTETVAVTMRIDNIFDKEYETFGTFGEADEVLGDRAGDSPLFFGPGAPRGVWFGIDLKW